MIYDSINFPAPKVILILMVLLLPPLLQIISYRDENNDYDNDDDSGSPDVKSRWKTFYINASCFFV